MEPQNVEFNEFTKRETVDNYQSANRYARTLKNDEIDSRFGFERYQESKEKLGFLINMHPSDFLNEDNRLISAVDYYFIQEDGSRFKATMPYAPYFYVRTRGDTEKEVSAYLSRKLSGRLLGVDIIEKEDLDLPNHLIGIKGMFLKLRFSSVDDLMKAKRDIMPAVKRNQANSKKSQLYDESIFTHNLSVVVEESAKTITDQLENIIEIREYDIPYHVRVSIDLHIHCGLWYKVKGRGMSPPDIKLMDDPSRPDPIVLAFDIETTKLPLKFPDSEIDSIMMVSYMIDGQGYLITNREIISRDVDDFEFTPRPEFEGPFTIFNEPNEKCLLERFIEHIQEVKPNIIVTYNGDMFDWPFVEARMSHFGMNLMELTGFAPDNQNEYKSRHAIHMDAYRWVKRDSYLPVGSQHLKAATREKLRYNPVEVDPEDMCRMANEDPQGLANYSVSDAVATYYLYMKYVHPFIFALCNIIPLEPDEVLRKGSGTLCETLLMVKAYEANIIFPNKQEMFLNKLTNDGHMLDMETYVGGHVEAIEAGVFRADIPYRFKIIPEGCQKLIDRVEAALQHAIEKEEGIPIEYATNFNEVCNQIKQKLLQLKENTNRLEKPMIYHLDVGAMYPNIILTNRLQPSSIVDEATCASCDFNRPSSQCQRVMQWMWRGDYMPASRSEIQNIRQQLEAECIQLDPSEPAKPFHRLSKEDQATLEKKRLQEYCKKAYRRCRVTREEKRNTTVCMRENSFYVDTVRAFRDRRYEFKGLLKTWKKKSEEAKANGDLAELRVCNGRVILYDSLQLAHKCILNSFYGYVMRKGARWHSMEMAGIVCYQGASIITKAREIVETIGRPLELDTDGIWCMLPSSFPENVTIHTSHPKKQELVISYPGAMLNLMVQENYTNYQYQTLNANEDIISYTTKVENSIFFEVDGPYLAMVLPAAKEEGKKLKKRYAVFNFDGSLAELKGFEVKRRGELQLVKNFQKAVFDSFLSGNTLEECYASVAEVADFWLDILYTKSENMDDSELFDLISENRNMSRKLEDYGQQKSTSISTAKRLAEFLGDQMVKDKGLSCRFIIAKKPEGCPVTERAIPLAIFFSEPSVKKHYLRKWLKDSSLEVLNIRSILDWGYYIERLGSAVQKIITIPAALQGITNPVSRVHHPEWLHKRLKDKHDIFKQKCISDMFSTVTREEYFEKLAAEAESYTKNKGTADKSDAIIDVEELANRSNSKSRASNKAFTRPHEQFVIKDWRKELGSAPDMGSTEEHMMLWVNFHKKKWKIQRRNKKLAKEKRNTLALQYTDASGAEANQGRERDNRAAGDLTRFLLRQKVTLYKVHWEIIEIVETDSPGLYTLWCIVGNDLHHVILHVPRVFYINCKAPEDFDLDGTVCRKVNKHLPRSCPAKNLYEFSIPERAFREQISVWTMQLSGPNIEGVYETRVPLIYRIIQQLGCICSVSAEHQQKLARAESEQIDLSQLKFEQEADFHYLEKDLKLIYMYQSAKESRSIFGLFILNLNKSHVFIVDTIRKNQLSNLKNLYESEWKQLSEEGQINPLPGRNFTFDARVDTELRHTYRHINIVLSDYLRDKRGPTVILLQTTSSRRKLIKSVTSLGDYPIVQLTFSESDNIYPTLDWQRAAAKTMLSSFLVSLHSYHLHKQLAKYGHVPLGNIPSDTLSFLADIFFARTLYKHNHLLWVSESPYPDLGGKEQSDYRLLSNSYEIRHIEINNPGTYTSVCIEFAVHTLALVGVLQSAHINDYEGGATASISFDFIPQASLEDMLESGISSSSILTAFDEAALCSTTFKLLRSMVWSWVKDIHHGNEMADILQQHFYRWLKSPTSLLYEPGLCRIIHKLMKKVFIQLISEFKRLGATIVYASFNKIVICTKKKSVEDALSYAEFILTSIHNRDLFHYVGLEQIHCWMFLTWMDTANYGGVLDDGSLDMNWNIERYLTNEASQRVFSRTIEDHISDLYSRAYEDSKSSVIGPEDTPMMNKSSMHASLTGMSVLNYTIQRIETTVTQQLYEFTYENMMNHFVHVNSKSMLDFVNFICQVLSLEANVQTQVLKLKRDLLKMINVGDFSQQAQFRNPCHTYTLPEVICHYCDYTKDLDLLRDSHNYYDQEQECVVWRCKCGELYDRDLIETQLVEIAQSLSRVYLLQDLVCQKCRQVMADNMSQFCSCAGSYSKTLSFEKFSGQMKVFNEIAKLCGLPYLHEIAKWIISKSHIA